MSSSGLTWCVFILCSLSVAHGQQVTPVVSFQQPVYRGIAGTDLRIVCDVVAFPAAMFVEIVQINGTEMQVNSETPTGGEMNIEIQYTIVNISLDLHNTTFACRANNSNGLSPAAITRIEVIDVPGVVDHSAITSRLLSLQSVQLTVPLPVENNAPVQNYTFQVCPEACFDVPDIVRDGTEGREFVFGGLQPNTEYLVFVFATNEAGRGSGSVVSFNFSSPSSADAAPVMLMDVIRTQTSLVFSWTLPFLALQENISQSINFTVTFGRDASGVVDTSVIPYSPGPLQGFSQGGLSPGMPYKITVTATYSSPVLVSDAISTVVFTTTEAPLPLVLMPPTAGVNSPAVLSFSWDVPPNAEFLLQYIVSYTVTSRLGNTRRRRQTMEIITTTPSASIMDPKPYSDYTVNVDGDFQPPGSTEPVRTQVTPETTFLSAQQPPNAPTSITGVGSSNGNPFTYLDVTWAAPSLPGGPISGCSIRTSPSSGSGPVTSVGDDTSHTLNGVGAGTLYTIFVTCTNGAGVGTPGSGSGMSSVGVQPPTINLFNINDDRRQITINIVVSSAFGPHSYYQVVVTTNPDFEPNAIASNELRPHPGVVTNGKQTYVALAGNSGSRSVVIGTGTTVTYRNVAYTDVSLSNDIDYYVFVRLFNNAGDFNDTATILGPYMFQVEGNDTATTLVEGNDTATTLDPYKFQVEGPIIGGVVALLVVMVIAVTIIIVTVLVLKKRRSWKPDQTITSPRSDVVIEPYGMTELGHEQ